MRWKCLDYNKRLQLEALLKARTPKKEIADILGCSLATVYNEIRRGSCKQLDTNLQEYYVYLADVGQRVHDDNVSNRGRFCKYAYNESLIARLRSLLIDKKFSPSACSVSLSCGISKGTIYNYIRNCRISGVSMVSLPFPRKHRSHHIKTSKSNVFARKSGKHISECPASFSDRSEYGHFEIDTVYSSKGSSSACLLTLTDRASRFEIIRKLPDRKVSSVVSVLPGLIKDFGIISITSDNGSEFLSCPDFVSIPWYFCDPYRSCQRGSNENYNRMIRRWFPKCTDFSCISDSSIQMVQDWINNYPVKKKSIK